MPYTPRVFSIEPLESRIAPAVLVVGANLLGGSGNPSTGESSAGGNAVTLIKVLSGEAIAWYDGSHITQVSFAPNTSLDLTGDSGDLVGNLTAAGRLSDSDHNPANGEDGDILLANNLLSLTTHPLSNSRGDVGMIITGGAVAHVTVAGKLHGIYAGDGSFQAGSSVLSGGAVVTDAGVPINPVDPNSSTGFAFQQSVAQLAAGASISGVTVAIADQMQVFAGSGSPHGVAAAGVGLPGGSVSGIHVVSSMVDPSAPSSTPSYDLRGGAGGAGAIGGLGGAVYNVFEETAANAVHIGGGRGGDGTVGAGGAGGGVSSLDLQGSSAVYNVAGGMGGTGKPGGAGGSLVHVNFAGQKPNSGIIVTADFNGDGFGDVLVVDSTSGDMVLSAGQPGGTTFKPVVQYYDATVQHNPVIRIASAGSTPTAAVAMDVNGDGAPDIVVAYKNSNSLGVFLNDGHGGFYNSTKKVFNDTLVGLAYSPDHMVEGNFGAGGTPALLISEFKSGNTLLHEATADGTGSLNSLDGGIGIAGRVTALAAVHLQGGDEAIAGTGSGQLYSLAPSGDPKAPLALTPGSVTMSGGIGALDANSTGDTLVAVGLSGHTVNAYGIGGQGALFYEGPVDLHNEKGATLSARFVVSATAGQADSLALLSSAGSGSDFSLYSPAGPVGGGYVFSLQALSSSGLNTFAVNYNYDGTGKQIGFGLAAVGGAPTQFVYTAQVGTPAGFALPFSGKTVNASGGAGGAGLGAASGGAGGSIFGINAQASDINLHGGTGGVSVSGHGGAGGSVINSGSFIGVGAETIVPILSAQFSVQVHGGDGGAPSSTASAATAAGGTGGSVAGLSLSVITGDLTITSGIGADGYGGAAGAGGAIQNLTAVNNSGNFSVTSGYGGTAHSGKVNGGAGGLIGGIAYKLTLDASGEAVENSYSVSLKTGIGGNSPLGVAGAGGSVAGVSLFLDGPNRSYNDSTVEPPLSDAHLDSTVRVTVTAGQGSDGATGGAGGAVSKLTSTSYFDQLVKSTITKLNYVVMSLTAGDGGVGSAGNGGAGGSVALTGAAPLQGITGYDPDSPEAKGHITPAPLLITAGSGHDGSVKGGAGGSIVGVVTQNAKFADGGYLTGTQLSGAVLKAGHGGNGGSSDGGAGGSILSSYLGVSDDFASVRQVDQLSATAGYGGTGGAKGGAGGAIATSYFADLAGNVFLTAGKGGTGVTAGGLGGDLRAIALNSPELNLGANVSLVAGQGGDATGAGAVGGGGGNISGITQTKDINSVISLLQAGNGGASTAGAGGNGGSVSSVRAIGFLGAPIAYDPVGNDYVYLGAFDLNGNPQGIFAGAGGAGHVAGSAGSIAAIIARQISAIGGAYDASSGNFAVAASVANVHADVIGYDVNHNGVFDTAGSAGASPSGTTPVDGFILAKSISGIVAQSAPFRFTA